MALVVHGNDWRDVVDVGEQDSSLGDGCCEVESASWLSLEVRH